METYTREAPSKYARASTRERLDLLKDDAQTGDIGTLLLEADTNIEGRLKDRPVRPILDGECPCPCPKIVKDVLYCTFSPIF